MMGFASSRTSIRRMQAADLEHVLAWRNHPEVRRWMFSRDAIGMDEHARWFARAQRNLLTHLLIFELDGAALGYVNLNAEAGDGSVDWGFYAAPGAPRGTGRLLGQAALDYAFSHAEIEKVCGRVLVFNERSLRMHEALGFRREAVLPRHHFDGESHHDVICFGLPRSEWRVGADK
jgi:UDP-4-amino-4,6-dideoxy-N-acetyl-beta-L-altrosamine N-acetyltransferase